MKFVIAVVLIIFIQGCYTVTLQEYLDKGLSDDLKSDYNNSHNAKLEKMPVIGKKCRKRTCREK